MLLVRARHYATGAEVDVRCVGGVIEVVGPASAAPADVAAQWVAPAFFDLQINGCAGHSFSSEALTLDIVRRVVAECRKHGIGALLPTLVTNSYVALHHGMETLRQACAEDSNVARAIAGI